MPNVTQSELEGMMTVFAVNDTFPQLQYMHCLKQSQSREYGITADSTYNPQLAVLRTLRRVCPVFPFHMFNSRRIAKLYLCIQVVPANRVYLGNLLKVHEVLESVHDCRILC